MVANRDREIPLKKKPAKPVEVGEVFGRLTVLRFVEPLPHELLCSKGARNTLFVEVQCSCPRKTIKRTRTTNLRSGKCKSCGCAQREHREAQANKSAARRRMEA